MNSFGQRGDNFQNWTSRNNDVLRLNFITCLAVTYRATKSQTLGKGRKRLTTQTTTSIEKINVL